MIQMGSKQRNWRNSLKKFQDGLRIIIFTHIGLEVHPSQAIVTGRGLDQKLLLRMQQSVPSRWLELSRAGTAHNISDGVIEARPNGSDIGVKVLIWRNGSVGKKREKFTRNGSQIAPKCFL
jgi:hypothetical protein